eukprot:4184814-Prymnesium_polylepis.2
MEATLRIIRPSDACMKPSFRSSDEPVSRPLDSHASTSAGVAIFQSVRAGARKSGDVWKQRSSTTAGSTTHTP